MTIPNNDHRIHLAANDPAFPAQREAAFGVIVTAIAAVMEPLDYTLRGTTWARETPAGKTAVNLQRSRYGFDAIISLRFVLPDGSAADTGLWAAEDEVTLAHFAPDATSDPGTISYLDVRDNPAYLDLPMSILRDHALPWLDAHHSGKSLPISPRRLP